MKNTLPEWLSYLEKSHPIEIDLGLNRIATVAKKMDLIHFDARVITVGGTNGKGTTCAFLEEILTQAGYRVGVYSSPHILRYTERLRINKEELSEAEHCHAFSQIKLNLQDTSLSYFEYVTLGCLYLLKQQKCDFILLEVGLGGRLDATNIVESDISVTTTIAIDHTDWLGDDREAIGFEKAGIYRSGKPVICGEYDPPTSLINHANNINADIYYANKDFSEKRHANTWDWRGKTEILNLPLTAMPVQNCSTALAVIEQLDLNIDQSLIRKAVIDAKLSGRFEKVEMGIANDVFIDVAHNPQSGEYLASQLQRIKSKVGENVRIISIVGMLQDKDCSGTFSTLNGIVDEYNFVPLECYRAASIEKLQSSYQNSIKTKEVIVNCFQNIEQAYKNIINRINDSDIIIVFGSFYTVSDFLQFSQGSISEHTV